MRFGFWTAISVVALSTGCGPGEHSQLQDAQKGGSHKGSGGQKPDDPVETGGRGSVGAGGRGGGGTGGKRSSGGAGPSDVDGGTGSGGDMGDVDAGKPVGKRRLPLPCVAPLPTGYCLTSDDGDYIGAGKDYSASGPTSVKMGYARDSNIGLSMIGSGDGWDATFAARAGTIIMPGLFDPAERWPFQMDTVAGLSISGNGRGCNELSGKFSIEELALDPASGVSRFSATFEQHCEKGLSALRGVVNFQATGMPDPTITVDRSIPLSGKIFHVVYDSTANVAYGLDASNRKIAKIDIGTGEVTYASVLQVPNDGCLDSKRGRLFVVNKGSSLITEYNTSDLTSVRDIPWAGMDLGNEDTHFKIYCGADQLYVVDGALEPGLFTVTDLDTADPSVTDRSSNVVGVGGLALNSASTELYYWYQNGWSAGVISTSVKRLTVGTFEMVDETSKDVASFIRNPLDAPVLLDERRGLVLVKNKIFDAANLTKLIYSLPFAFDTFEGAQENAYAVDSERGRVATKRFVYELDRYEIVTRTAVPFPDQLFFAADGVLWALSISAGALQGQIIR